MQCVRPKKLFRGEGQPLVVPCGRCIACRVALTNEWTTRLMHEAQYHEESCFITLTYRPEDEPPDMSLSKRELQLFVKRLRKRIEPVIKYYGVGEYGDEGDRPHYHLIVFGWSPPLSDLYVGSRKKGKVYYASRFLQSVWSYGFNTVGNVTRDSCQYTAGYVRKKLYGSAARKVYNGRVPPFALQSRGFGARYAVENEARIKAHLYTGKGKKDVCTPRYYTKLLNVDAERLKMRSYERQADVLEAYAGLTPEEIYTLYEDDREQRERILNFKERRK